MPANCSPKMTAVTTATPDPANDKDMALGHAFVGCKSIFDGLSNKDRLELLRSLGGLYGHRVLPGLGTGPQSGPAKAVKEGRVPKGPPQPKTEKSAEQLRLQKEVTRVNRAISFASKEAGSRLPQDHPLLSERGNLFRALSAEKGTNPSA
jgi:hypothetical protein